MTPFDRAQANYDAMEHPDYWLDVHEPDEEDEEEELERRDEAKHCQ